MGRLIGGMTSRRCSSATMSGKEIQEAERVERHVDIVEGVEFFDARVEVG